MRAAISAVGVLKVGTSQTRPVKRSICTCKKSWPERATGSSRKSSLMQPPRQFRDWVGEEKACRRQMVHFDALTGRAGAHVLLHCLLQTLPGHHTERLAGARVLSRPK